MSKIGVYVCHCCENIAGVVDVEDVRQFAEGMEGSWPCNQGGRKSH